MQIMHLPMKLMTWRKFDIFICTFDFKLFLLFLKQITSLAEIALFFELIVSLT